MAISDCEMMVPRPTMLIPIKNTSLKKKFYPRLKDQNKDPPEQKLFHIFKKKKSTQLKNKSYQKLKPKFKTAKE